jgi:hypothetical protein
MGDVVITGHGGREGGSSTGTYVVPKGVTIYFFTPDHSVMYAGASDKMMDYLCAKHTYRRRVQAAAVQVKKEFDILPNYICYGTNDFRDPSGVYLVGKNRSEGPILSIPDKTQKTLSEIIGGAGKGVIGSNIYWLCCRAAPDNSNNLDDDKDVVTGVFRGKNIGATEEASHTGLTPSQVKQLGSWR